MKILILLLSLVVKSSQLTEEDCGSEWRRQRVDDISVDCGTSIITLVIKLCPAAYDGYNLTRLILNNRWEEICRATVDESVTPVVARFSFPLNMTNACDSQFRTTSSPGTGVFSQFSNIQRVNVSGVVVADDTTTGMVTYKTQLKYFYSCAYPLEYLINNTQIDVSSSSIAIRDNNGSFISTLSLSLFTDSNYLLPMTMPADGLELRTVVYVEVKATNLTAQYHVLLDRCYASVSPLPSNSSHFDLFVSCSTAPSTTIYENGDSQIARFSFPAFRFLEQQELMKSTYYLHCITRLCEISTCSGFKVCQGGERRRRDTVDTVAEDMSETYTLTSPEIVTQAEPVDSKEQLVASKHAESTVGLGVAVGVLAVGCVIAFGLAVVFYRKIRY